MVSLSGVLLPLWADAEQLERAEPKQGAGFGRGAEAHIASAAEGCCTAGRLSGCSETKAFKALIVCALNKEKKVHDITMQVRLKKEVYICVILKKERQL